MGWLADILQGLPVSAALKAKLQKLEAENNDLKSELEQYKKVNAYFKAELGKYQQPEHLSKEEVEIIKVLAKYGSLLSVADIAGLLDVHPTRAEHFLIGLEQNEYVRASYSYVEDSSYGLTNKGQEYAFMHSFV